MGKNIKMVKQNLLKSLLSAVGQNKICDSLVAINKCFDILEKEIKELYEN